MEDSFVSGVVTTVLVILIVFIVVGAFNLNRARILQYELEGKECVVRSAKVERCYPVPAE